MIMSLPESFTIYSIQTTIDGTTYYVQPIDPSTAPSQLTLTQTTNPPSPPSLSQLWVFTQSSAFPGSYMIVNAQSGYCIESAGGDVSPTNGTVVQQNIWQQTQNQAWILTENSDGTFQISSSLNPQEFWYATASAPGLVLSSAQPPLSFSLVANATLYCCDLGFDWNAVATGGSATLQANLMSKPYNSPAWFTQFEVNDQIFFVLYDITSLNTPGDPSVTTPNFTFTMTFTSPDSITSLTPLTPTPYSITSLVPAPLLGDWYSMDFGKTLPAYAVGVPTISGLPSQTFTFNTAGQFAFQCQVEITAMYNGETSTQTYVFDPEMIVGPST